MNLKTDSRRPGNLILANDRGAALAVAILMLLGLAAMGMAAIAISSTDFVVAGMDRERTMALNTAEAGLAEAMHRMSLRPGETVTYGGAQINASIGDPSSPPDPNWQARIFLTPPAAPPAPASASEFTTGTIQAPGNYLTYSDPNDRNDAILIRHKLRDFDGDGTPEVSLYDPSVIPPENPNTGFPIERITVTGKEVQAERAIQADVIRFPINPQVSGALTADGSVDLRGNVTVCGHDHRLDTPPGTQLPSCSPNWDEGAGHLPAVTTTGAGVSTQGSTDLLGSPSPTNTSNTNTFRSLAETLGLTQDELQQILDSADRSDLSGPAPWDGITYIQGDERINGGTGSGLLYVTGDLELRGNFEWTGLVYVEGQFSNTGNTWILGGVMARGVGSLVAVDFGAGTPAILYSQQALMQSLTAAMSYTILSWKEL